MVIVKNVDIPQQHMDPVGDKGTAFVHIPKECSACSSLKEYEDIDFRVGDKVSIEIKKKEDSGI